VNVPRRRLEAAGGTVTEKETTMLKTLFASTALASVLALGAYAQQAADPAADPAPMPPATDAPATPEVMPDTAQETPMAPDTETADDPATSPMAPQDPVVGEAPMLTPVAPDQISAETLIGANIQTMNGEDIAQVEDVILTPDGVVENIAAQFGGFLGFGSNTVLLTMDEIEVLQDEAGNIVVHTALTPEALEGRPDYQPAN
jgi:hypothetical protein